MLTYYAVVEEPPKENTKYDETHMVLEDHLRSDCPIEEASVRRVSEPAKAECRYIFGRTIRGNIPIYTLFDEPMTLDFFVGHHVGEVGRGLYHSQRPQGLTCKHRCDP